MTSATDELLKKLRMLKYDYDSMSTSCEDAIDEIADELEQTIAATLGDDRLAFLERKVNLQGDYIDKLTKEKNALFTQNCEAATRHAGQMDAMQRKLEAATLGRGECEECARTAKKMLEIANEMRHIGASSMTPHQLFCCWAHDIERAVKR